MTPTPAKDRTKEGVGVTRPLRDALNDTSIYLPVTARVAAMRPLTKLETVFTVELPQGLTLQHEPGQFVEVSVFGVGEAPISISS